MEGITIPSDIPEDLKKACDSLVKRANEVKRTEPVIAYWCCFAAAQNALKVPNRTGAGTMYLMSLLDCLEEMKSALATNEAITNEAVGSAYVENFALRIFVSADTDERKGKFDRGVIQRFAVSAQFMEALRCFEGGLSEEMEQRRKYALWKAADLSKCLREGRKPVPGPPGGEENDEAVIDSALDTLRRDSSSSQNVAKDTSRRSSGSGNRPTSITMPQSPPLDVLPRPALPDRFDSANWSTLATPGAGDPDELARSKPPGAEDKTVRFRGPDGAPLSPPETFVSLPQVPEVAAPPPTEISSSWPSAPATSPPKSASPTKPSPSLPPPQLPRVPSPALPSPPRLPSPPQLPSPPTVPSPPKAPTPRLPSPTKPPAPAPRASPMPPPPVPAPTPTHVHAPIPARLGRKETELVQKHARWAISALDYDDYETARKELELALSMLPPHV